jgi:DNA repair exonuclease SbcCD ATPase subunit
LGELLVSSDSQLRAERSQTVALKKENQQLRKAIEMFKHRESFLLKELSRQSQIEYVTQDVLAIYDSLGKAVRENEDTASKINELQDLVETVRNEKLELAGQFQAEKRELEQALETLRTEKGESETALDELQLRNDLLAGEVSAFKAKHESLLAVVAESDSAKEKLVSDHLEVLEAKDKELLDVSTARNEANARQEKFARAASGWKAKYDTQLEKTRALQAELTAAQEQLESLEEAHDAEIEQLRALYEGKLQGQASVEHHPEPEIGEVEETGANWIPPPSRDGEGNAEEEEEKAEAEDQPQNEFANEISFSPPVQEDMGGDPDE